MNKKNNATKYKKRFFGNPKCKLQIFFFSKTSNEKWNGEKKKPLTFWDQSGVLINLPGNPPQMIRKTFFIVCRKENERGTQPAGE